MGAHHQQRGRIPSRKIPARRGAPRRSRNLRIIRIRPGILWHHPVIRGETHPGHHPSSAAPQQNRLSGPRAVRLTPHEKGNTMSLRTMPVSICIILMVGLLSACNRDQDKTTPVGQQPQGQSTAQDYPSTRNMEQSNPAVGGNNSATNQQAPPAANQQPPAGSGSR